MIIEGKFSVKAPIQKLWDTLFDVEALAACLPGAEKIEKIDDKTYDVTMKQRVGMIKVTTELAGGEVEIAYKIDGSMVGKLAMFGDRIMRSKANEVEKEFVKNLQGKLKALA